MEDSTLGVMALYALLGLALLTLWLRHQAVLRQRERMREKMGALQGDLSDTSQRLDLLSRGVDTVLSETPGMQGLLDAHKSLESAETLLFEQDVNVSSSESVAIASHAAKTILVHYPGLADEDGHKDVVPGLLPLVERLDAILNEAEMQSEDLELTGNQHRRLGELFHGIDRTIRASDFYRRAHSLSAEDADALRSLASIHREEGDMEALDRSLERLLAVDPDDIAVLKEQALLLSGADEERVTRNYRRLEGLGVEFDISLATTELSDIVERAREVNREVDPSTIEPETSTGWLERAARLLMIGEITVALESVEKAIETNPDNGEAWMLHAKLLSVDEDRTKESLQSIRRATALGQYGVILESEIFENDGRLDAARAVLEERLETNPEDAEARARLSLVLLRAGANEWSRKVLDEAPPGSWESAPLHVMDGRLHLLTSESHRDNTGHHDQLILLDALVAFDGAIDRDRESGLAWLGRSRALRYQGAPNEAEVALTRARRLIPEHPSIPLEEAQLCLDLGRLEQADTLVSEAATQLNDHSAIPFVRGMIAARQNRLTEAISLFTKVLTNEPDHVRARLNKCSASLLKGDLATALDDADHLVSNRPRLDMARLRRSEILMSHGDWDEAEAELRRLLGNRPDHTMALVHLGTCLIARGRAEQAEKPLNTALQIDSTHSDAWYQRGLLYLDFGRLEDAMHDFENAAENDEHHIDARLRIATLLHEAEDMKGATEAWRNVLDVDPEHRLARRRLEECRGSSNPPKPNPQSEG